MDLSLLHLMMLAGAGFVATSINAVAGGGTCISFPILLLTGIPPIQANTTNTVGIWCGTLSAVFGYRKELAEHKPTYKRYAFTCLAGSAVGSFLLLATPSATFEGMVPWLMFAATLIFAFGRRFTTWLHTRYQHHPNAKHLGGMGSHLGLFCVSIYGGFFGAGIGILTLAMFELMRLDSIHKMNGLKSLLTGTMNAICAAIFVVAGNIVWPAAAAMSAGALLGGYGGASIARKLPQAYVRRFVIFYAGAMTIYLFVR